MGGGSKIGSDIGWEKLGERMMKMVEKWEEAGLVRSFQKYQNQRHKDY